MFVSIHIHLLSQNKLVPNIKSCFVLVDIDICIVVLSNISSESYVSVHNRLTGLVGRVFANGPGDLGSIPDHIIPKTLKMVLDTSLLNTQQYKVHIEGKVEQSRERSSALSYSVVGIEKGAFWLPSTMVANIWVQHGLLLTDYQRCGNLISLIE